MAVGELSKKLKLKQGQRALVINAPKKYFAELANLPDGVEMTQNIEGLVDWAQLFVHNQAELAKLLPQVLDALKPETTLWITFPKGTSGLQTDLTRDKGWDPIRDTNLRWVTLISINQSWSAFGFRPLRPGEPRNDFMNRD